MMPVPVLTPALSSLWLGLVTPLYAQVGRKLIEGVRNPTVVADRSALDEFQVRPRGMSEAIRRALANEDREFAATRWSDAALGSHRPAKRELRYGRRLVDSRSARVDVTVRQAFEPLRRIGGDVGWYSGDVLWRIRGLLDRLVGGPGLRRGRRDPVDLRPGDALDFWRVEAFEEPRLLRLRAEMRLPGRAWLQFEVEGAADGTSVLTQTAVFDPAGLFGRLYWYALLPVHTVMFRSMLRNIVRVALSAGRPAASSARFIASPQPRS
jgi:hypothetical protein